MSHYRAMSTIAPPPRRDADRIANPDAPAASPRTSPHTTSKFPLPLETVDRQKRRARGGSSKRRLLLLLLVLGALAAFGFANRRVISDLVARQAAEPAVAAPVGPRPVFALGRLEPAGEVIQIAAPDGVATARVERLLVSEGDRVEAGQMLAVLDNEPRLKAAEAVAASQLEQSRVRLAQARIVARSSQGEIEAKLRSARADREMATIQLERNEKLRGAAAISRQNLEDAQLRLEAAEASVAELTARLVRYESVDGSEPIDVAVARQEVAVAEAALAESQARLKQAYVVAPAAGTVLDVDVRPGETVGQSRLLDLGAVDDMKARVEVYESDVRRLAVGQAVSLTSPALAEELSGMIESMSATVQKQSVVDADPAANTDARVIEVRVDLDDASSAIAGRFVELQVRAEFEVDR